MSTLITIDLDALIANYRACARRLQPASVAAVVKANAYGLGIRKIAPALYLAGCRQFFTATHREAVKLRSILPDADIFVFEGVTERSASHLLKNRLVPVLHTPEQVTCWTAKAESGGQPLPAIIHIDTGMTRLGMGEPELHQVVKNPAGLEQLDLRYVMTHFASADEPGAELAKQQLERYADLRSLLPAAPSSIGNSAGALLGGRFAGDMVRVGIALYGGNPFPQGEPPFAPVLRIQSKILQLREIREAVTVGYGATYTAAAGSRIATVGTGYADGYPWALGNKGVASVGGYRVPVVGRISMDLITLDVTDVPKRLVQPGRQVDLIGPQVSLEEVAQRAGTINYEILTGLGQRARRKFLGGRGAGESG
jgi:alanine racemase